MRKRVTCLLMLILMMLSLTLSGCGANTVQESNAGSDTITVTDMLGREVSIPGPVDKVVAVSPGTLRFYCYVNGANKVVGVEQLEKNNPMGRPYFLAYPSLADLPVIGPGGPNNSPDAEKILAVEPDVIFMAYVSDKATLDELQAKTGIPCVALSYGKVCIFDPSVYDSLKLIGKIVGQEERAQEIVDYMELCKKDLDDRTNTIPDNELPSVYVGAISCRGMHGIESTRANNPLLNVVNAKNVVDETGQNGSLMIEKEQLLQWNPDKIIIDLGGYSLVKQDYQNNPDYYNNLSAVKNGELYSQLPYNYYHTNIGTALADAYYIGKVLYPEQFKDIDPEKKADEIYTKMVNKAVYQKMAEDFGGFKKLTLN